MGSSLTNLLEHDHTTEPGMALRHWVDFQGVHSLLDLLSWDPEELEAVSTQQVYFLDNQGQYIHLRTNQVKQICGLLTYMKNVFESYNSGTGLPDDPFHPFHLMNGPTYTYSNEDPLGSTPPKSSWA